MQNTKITRARIRHHFQYSWWKYLTLAIVAVMGWSLIFTTTAYRAPRDKRLDVFFATYSLPVETQEWIQNQILSMFPDVEDSECRSIIYSDEDMYGPMQLSTYMAAGEGDIYILNREAFDSLKTAEGFWPLDEAIEAGKIDLRGIDTTKGKVLNAQGAPETLAIPTAALGGLQEHSIHYEDLYICVMANSPNMERAYVFIDWLIAETLDEALLQSITEAEEGAEMNAQTEDIASY